MKFALEHFHKFCWGERISIFTDCIAVANLLRNDQLPPQHALWKETILSYNIVEMVHRPGRGNPMDALSRWGVLGQLRSDGILEPGWEKSVGLINDMFVLSSVLSQPISDPPSIRSQQPLQLPLSPVTLGAIDSPKIDELIKSFEEEPMQHNICLWLSSMTLPDDLSADAVEQIKSVVVEYFIDQGKLWRLRQHDDHAVRCVPKAEGLIIMQSLHRSHGHWARDILLLKAFKLYGWPGMKANATQVIKSCQYCQQFGPAFINFLLQPIFRSQPFDLLAGDYVFLPPGNTDFRKL